MIVLLTGKSRVRRGRLRRLEPPPSAGVIGRDITNFKSFWKTTTFSSILDPSIYLLAFGSASDAGHRVNGLDYCTSSARMVATAVLFSSVFSAIYGVFIEHRFQHTYDAILAAPVDVEELATAEIGCSDPRRRLRHGAAAGDDAVRLDPSWGDARSCRSSARSPGWASPALGVFAAASVSKIDHFSYIQSALITPLFLVSGTFFPIDAPPARRADHVQFNPLYHCVELVRDAVVFGSGPRTCGTRVPDRVRGDRLAARGLAPRQAAY